MSQIARTLMLPHENAPLRLPTFPNLERTAVCGFETNLETNSAQFGLPTRRYVLIRNPAAPFWMDYKVLDTDTDRAQLSYLFDAVTDVEVENPVPFAVGERAPIGVDGSDYWLYFPCNFDGGSFSTTAMFVRSDSQPVTISYSIMKDDGRVTSYTANVSTTMGVLNGTQTTPCWVRINTMRCSVTGGAGRLIVFPAAGARALWPAYSPPQVEVSTAPYTASRVTALTLLATNVSRVQIKQGTIMAARFSAATPSFWSALPSHVNGVHPAERYYGACENGLYMVAPPTQDSELFADRVLPRTKITGITSTGGITFGTTTSYPAVVDFNSDDPFLAGFISEEASIDETLMALTVDIHLEFRTSSPLFQVGISSLQLETYHASQLVVAQAGFFYENSTHWKELATKIARLATTVIPVLFPATRVARLAGAASLLLNSRPNRQDMGQKQMVKPTKPKQPARKKKVKAKTKSRKR